MTCIGAPESSVAFVSTEKYEPARNEKSLSLLRSWDQGGWPSKEWSSTAEMVAEGGSPST